MGHRVDDRHFDSLELTIDAVDVEKTADFWTAALGYSVLYHRAPYVVLGPTNGGGLRLVVQRVVQRNKGKSPVHLDLRVHEPSREVERLVSLGARVERVIEEAGKQWTVMTDPEGTVFCVCPARRDPEGPAGSDADMSERQRER
jgi:catechol 2,3-dioxygenase-like lactoylglutathione lyase family enzyme